MITTKEALDDFEAVIILIPREVDLRWQGPSAVVRGDAYRELWKRRSHSGTGSAIEFPSLFGVGVVAGILSDYDAQNLLCPPMDPGREG